MRFRQPKSGGGLPSGAILHLPVLNTMNFFKFEGGVKSLGVRNECLDASTLVCVLVDYTTRFFVRSQSDKFGGMPDRSRWAALARTGKKFMQFLDTSLT